MKNAFAFALLASFVSIPAFATVGSVNYSAIVNLRFPNQVDGKPVASVLAHVGLRQKAAPGYGGAEGWEDAQDVQLTAKGQGFAGTATLGSAVSFGSPGSPVVYGPAASYLVTLKSGESLWVSNVSIPVSQVLCTTVNFGPNQADRDGFVATQAYVAKSARLTASDALFISSAGDGNGGTACVGQFMPTRN